MARQQTGQCVAVTEASPRVDLVRRLLWLILLAAPVVAALAYPFRLSDALLAPVERWAMQGSVLGRLYMGQVRSLLAFNHSPLVYKECIAAGYLLVALCVYPLFRLLTGAAESPASFPFSRKTRLVALLRRLGANPVCWVAGLLLYTGLSALLLSPTFHYSIRTYMEFALGVLFLLAIRGLSPGARMARKFMAAICVAGFVIVIVSMLQHLGLAASFMPPFDDPRNRMGSFIGHNTGLSSWLMFPLCFALAFAVMTNRKWVRIAAIVLVAMILFVIVAAQSRAVWLILPLVLVLYAPVLAGKPLRRIPLRYWLTGLAVVLAIVTLLSVDIPGNPFARPGVSLRDRVLKHFAPGQLLKETRLRILVMSLPLVKQKPLLGHGFGSFQYVYPVAQGEYFLKHPDTLLGTTPKRSDLAHNDYLQFLVETGLLGFLLAGVPLFMFLRRGWVVFRRLPEGPDRVLLGALFFPAAGVAVHALVDFPFHIMPVALAWAACLGFWSSPETLIGARSCRLATDDSQVAGAAEDSTEPNGVQVGTGVRWRLVAALSSLSIAVLLSVYGYQFVLREFISDIYYVDGANWMNTYKTLAPADKTKQLYALSQARENYRKANRINMFNGQAFEGMSYADLNWAILRYQDWRDALARGDQKSAEEYRLEAKRFLNAAIHLAGLAIPEYRYHFIYYLIGESNYMLARLDPGNAAYWEAARAALSKAVETNVADTSSLFELSELLERMPRPDPAYAARLKRLIFKYDPAFGVRHYLDPIFYSADRGDFVSARSKLQSIEAAVPDDWRVVLSKADLFLRTAVWPPAELDAGTSATAAAQWFRTRLNLGMESLKRAEKSQPEEWGVRYIGMLYAAASGDWARGLELADSLHKDTPDDRNVTVLRALLAERAGQKRDLWEGYETDTEYLTRLQRFRINYLGQQTLGARQLARLATKTRVELPDGLRAAAHLRALGEWSLLTELGKALRTWYPADPAVAELWQQIAAHEGLADSETTASVVRVVK